jgi:DNA helicase II / ATP-dependent DNA helicase PcrA
MPGIGPATAGRVLDQIGGRAHALAELAAPPRCVPEWQDFVDLMSRLALRAAGWPAELAAVRDWYQPHLERLHEDADARVSDLRQLEQIAASHPSRERFLTELTLDPPNASSDLAGVPLRDEDYLILSTIHSAKGQEWNSVFVLNGVDGCIPSDLSTGTTEDLEEERRMLYVAMTRAKQQLDIVLPQRFYVHQQSSRGDGHLYASRTRFIPNAILAHFESRSWPVASRDTATDPTGRPTAKIDLGSRMRGMWR